MGLAIKENAPGLLDHRRKEYQTSQYPHLAGLQDHSRIDRAKNNLSILELWRVLGLPGTPSRSGQNCRSPFREDRAPSFSIYDHGKKWKDHGTNEGGDAIDFVAKARNLSNSEATKEFLRLAGEANEPSPPKKYRSFAQNEDWKSDQRKRWQAQLTLPTDKDIATIAYQRNLSIEGVQGAAKRGLLYCMNTDEGRAWIISDKLRINAQARRIDGHLWEGIDAKAKTLPGSIAGHPVGLPEAEEYPCIALVEGSTDFLAAFHLAWIAGTESQVAPVAMLGASQSIPKEDLPSFQGKRIRIFSDADEAGKKAMEAWCSQLAEADIESDGYNLAGFTQASGHPVKDLNDFVHIDVNQWEAERAEIEQAFHFNQEYQT